MNDERLRKLDEVLESIEKNNRDLKAIKTQLEEALEETQKLNRKYDVSNKN